MENEKFLNYEITLDFSSCELDDLNGEVKVSIAEVKKSYFDEDQVLVVVVGTVVGNPNYLVAGLKMDDDFALAFIGVKSKQIYFSSIVNPVFIIDYYGGLGELANQEFNGFCSRVLGIEQVNNLDNPQLFDQIAEKINNKNACPAENAVYSFLSDNSHLVAELYTYYRNNVRILINQSIFTFLRNHYYEDVVRILSKHKIDKKFMRMVNKLYKSSSEKTLYNFLDMLEDLDDDEVVKIFSIFQNHTDRTNAFEEFETDIFKEGIDQLLEDNEAYAENVIRNV